MIKRALVLGATGMLGCHALHACLRRGIAVRALVRPGSSTRILDGLGVEIVSGDLRDRDSLASAFAGCDLAIHAAAPYPKKYFGKRAFLDAARAGMTNLLAAAHAAAALDLTRLVYVSSVTTIGRPASDRDGALARESDVTPIADRSPYFSVKAMLEQQAREAAGAGLPLVIVNPTFCVDEYDDHRTTAQLLVPLAKGQLPVYIAGNVNAVPTRDVGEGILLAAERGRSGERYTLGGENLTSREFLERCARSVGVSAPRHALPFGLATAASYATEIVALLTRTAPLFPMTGIRMIKNGQPFDISRARAELGYAPTSLDEAIARAYAWYRQRGFI
jgi:dihydroflavonol-4-reductase